MDTKQVLSDMLRENTGRHMLDSGGAYGRHWERNQERSFADEPATVLRWEYSYISVLHNVYHWLVDRLEYDPDLDAEFHKWADATEERRGAPWLALMEEWTRDVLPNTVDEDGLPREVTGLYGDAEPFCVNTCNGEDLLSQVIQYMYFGLDDEEYVLLQIHGGCDVRGGYTAPRAFRVTEDTAIFDNARASIVCDGPLNPDQIPLPYVDGYDDLGPHNWYTDDGCHWYDDGACGVGAGRQLEEYEVTKAEDGDEWTPGKLHVREDDSMQCPKCGGKLSAGS